MSIAPDIDIDIHDFDVDELIARDIAQGRVEVPPYPSVVGRGVNSLTKTAMTAWLAHDALKPGPLFALRSRVWRESLSSALVAEAIAASRGVADDTAYLAGLLHDFGKIIALSYIERGVSNIDETEQFWLEVIERHHCDLGWIMADLWELPDRKSVV